MALSGSVTTTGGYEGRNYTLSWTATQSVSNNRSTISYTLSCAGGSPTWYAERTLECVVAGTTVISKTNRVERYPGNILTGTVTVNHDPYGRAAFTVSIRAAVYGSTVNATGTATFALNDIPRASDVSVSSSTVTVNGSNKSTVTVTPKVNTYSHVVTWKIGNYSHSVTLAAGTKTAEYAIQNDWKNAFPNAKTGTCTVSVQTKSGSTNIGSAVSKTFTLSCDGSEVPSFTLTTEDVSGIRDKIGCYVIGRSKIKATVSGIVYAYGATLKSIDFNISGNTVSGTATSATAAGYVTKSSNTVKAVLTDSRGYSTTVSTTFPAFDYRSPSLNLSISRYRKEGTDYVKDDEGGYGRVSYSAFVIGIGRNAIKEVRIEYRSQDGSDDGGTITLTSDHDVQYVPCSTEKVYNFEVSVEDELQKVVYLKQLSSAITIMDVLRGGHGVCFGGVAVREDTLDVRWPLFIEGHDSKVGTEVGGDGSTVTVESGKWVKVQELTLSAGVWVIYEGAEFDINAIGYRRIQSTMSANAPTSMPRTGAMALAKSGVHTYASETRPRVLTTEKTIYLYAYQDSGSSLSVNPFIYAYRIA